MKTSAQMKSMAAKLEQFSVGGGLAHVLDDTLLDHVDEAREHLEVLAAELSSAGL